MPTADRLQLVGVTDKAESPLALVGMSDEA